MNKVCGFVLAALLCVGSWGAEIVLTVPVETSDLRVKGTIDTQKSWIRIIQGAKSTLDIEQFYISDQKGGKLEPVLDAIRDAAKRKVQVRLIGDSKFFKTYPESYAALADVENIEARIIDFGKVGGGVQHAKFLIADNKDFYLGSANFDWRALEHIHELGIQVSDVDLATSLGAVFDADWAEAKTIGKTKLPPSTKRKVTKTQSGDLTLVASPKGHLPSGIGDTLTAILGLLAEADSSKDTVDIQVMEHTTKPFSGGPAWNELDSAIRAAAKKGARVRLVVESKSAAKAKKVLSSLAKLSGIEVKQVSIPEASSGPIEFARLVHSKYLIVNGKKAWLGTDNWSKGYFYDSRGVGVVIDSSVLVSKMAEVFDRLWESPYATLIR